MIAAPARPKRGRPRKHEHALNATSGRKRGRTLYSLWQCDSGCLHPSSIYLYEGLRPTKPEGYVKPSCKSCDGPLTMKGLFFIGPDRRTRELAFVPAEAYLEQYDKWRAKVFNRYYRGDLCSCGHWELHHEPMPQGPGRCMHIERRPGQPATECSCTAFVSEKDSPARLAIISAPPDEDVPF